MAKVVNDELVKVAIRHQDKAVMVQLPDADMIPVSEIRDMVMDRPDDAIEKIVKQMLRLSSYDRFFNRLRQRGIIGRAIFIFFGR